MGVMDEAEQCRWRETYFVWFPSEQRPRLEELVGVVRHLRGHFELLQPQADERGLVESLTVRSDEDHAALEIDYAAGEDIVAEAAAVAEDLKPGDGVPPDKLRKLLKCDARFEVMHFELLPDDADDEDLEDEMFDPSALLIVLEALVKLTGGVGHDPQSGTLM